MPGGAELPDPPPPQAERHSAAISTISGPLSDIPGFLAQTVLVYIYASVDLKICRTKRGAPAPAAKPKHYIITIVVKLLDSEAARSLLFTSHRYFLVDPICLLRLAHVAQRGTPFRVPRRAARPKSAGEYHKPPNRKLDTAASKTAQMFMHPPELSPSPTSNPSSWIFLLSLWPRSTG
jgi:hypothetical protein